MNGCLTAGEPENISLERGHNRRFADERVVSGRIGDRAQFQCLCDKIAQPVEGNGLIPVTLDLAGGLSVIRELL